MKFTLENDTGRAVTLYYNGHHVYRFLKPFPRYESSLENIANSLADVAKLSRHDTWMKLQELFPEAREKIEAAMLAEMQEVLTS